MSRYFKECGENSNASSERLRCWPLRWEVGLSFLVLSGIFLVAAFPPWNAGGMVWIGWVPALFAIRNSPFWSRHAFVAGYVVGLIFFGGTLWWIGKVTGLGASALVAYLAFYPALWLGMMQRWQCAVMGKGEANSAQGGALRLWRSGAIVVMGASLWVVLEFFRGWLFTGFPWNNMGVALWQNVPLIQWAKWGGVFLLSWWVVAVNLWIGLGWERLLQVKSRQPMVEWGIALVMMVGAFVGGVVELKEEAAVPHRLRYFCLQPNIAQDSWKQGISVKNILEKQVELTQKGLALGVRPDVVIWPEATTSRDPRQDKIFRSVVRQVRDLGDFYFLFGGQASEPVEAFNVAFWQSPHEEELHIYSKNKLVPFGEYVPWEATFPFLRELVPFSMDFTPGTSPRVFEIPELGLKVCPLICFEDTLPRYVRRAAAWKPDIWVNITNDSWFSQSPGAEQHWANALLRTVETGRPMIRCGNTGVTCVISPQGVVEKILNERNEMTGKREHVGVEGVLQGELVWHASSDLPFYQQWGDWVIVFSGIICFSGSIALWRKGSDDKF